MIGRRSPARSTRRIIRLGLIALLLALALSASGAVAAPSFYRVDHVSDGDTVALRNGQRVRLVQIDTPEVFFGRECYGRAASAANEDAAAARHAGPAFPEPATDRVDRYGRLLRYVVRVRDGVNVNIRLVAVGAAAPYFYRRGEAVEKTKLELYEGCWRGRL